MRAQAAHGHLLAEEQDGGERGGRERGAGGLVDVFVSGRGACGFGHACSGAAHGLTRAGGDVGRGFGGAHAGSADVRGRLPRFVPHVKWTALGLSARRLPHELGEHACIFCAPRLAHNVGYAAALLQLTCGGEARPGNHDACVGLSGCGQVVERVGTRRGERDFKPGFLQPAKAGPHVGLAHKVLRREPQHVDAKGHRLVASRRGFRCAGEAAHEGLERAGGAVLVGLETAGLDAQRGHAGACFNIAGDAGQVHAGHSRHRRTE